MNLRNILENGFYIIATALISSASSSYFTNKYTSEAYERANNQVLEAFMPIVKEEFRKETNKIENTFKTEIEKVKTNKGVVTIDYKPNLENTLKFNKKEDLKPLIKQDTTSNYNNITKKDLRSIRKQLRKDKRKNRKKILGIL